MEKNCCFLRICGIPCFITCIILLIIITIVCNSINFFRKEKFNPCIRLSQSCSRKNLDKKNEYLCINECETVIPDEYFKGYEKLKRLDFKGDLTYLGKNAFSGCENLEEINFGGKLEYYDPDVFKVVKSLKRISFQNLTIIRQNSFAELSGLEYVTIKSGLELIEDGAFKNCGNLRSLRLPLPAPKIEDGFINSSNLVEFLNPNCSAISCGEMVFWNNDCIKSLIIPGNWKILSDWMFACCSNLEYVEIPDFVSEINSHCFSACKNLKEINYHGDFRNFVSIYPSYREELKSDCVIRTSDCHEGKTVSEWIKEQSV